MVGNLLIRPITFKLEHKDINILDTNKYFFRFKIDD